MKNIVINNLNFKYPDKKIVFEQANIKIAFNKVTLLQGENGSGKTTLCRLLTGLEKLPAESIFLDELSVKSKTTSELAKYFLYLKQEPLANCLAATPKNDFEIRQHKFRRKLINSDKIEQTKIFKYLSLMDIQDSLFNELSGGEIKRCGIAGLKIENQKYWILDEPEANLDFKMREKLFEIIAEHKAKGFGCLIITHQEKYFEKLIDLKIEIKEKKFFENVKLKGKIS